MTGTPLSGQDYAVLVEQAPLLIWRSDVEGLCDYFNERWLAFTGRTTEQEAGDGWVQGVHPADLEPALTAYRASFARREPFELTYRLRRFDGVYRWLFDRGVPVFDADGTFRGYTGSCVDVHEAREASLQLQRSEAELASIYENAPLLMLLLDHNQRVVRFNNQLREYIGLGNEGAPGARCGELLGCVTRLDTPEGCGFTERCARCGVRATILETAATGVAHRRVESSHRCERDGELVEVTLLVSTARLTVEDEFLTLLCLEDVSELQSLERQLRQAQKMETIGLLAGGIAHDFNNILTPILGYAEMARDQLPAGSPVQDDMAMIVTAAQRAQELIGQILTLTRRREQQPAAPVHLGSLVKETARFMSASLPATIEIEADVAPDCGLVEADVSQLHQAVLNLCTNAGYAMRETGGKLTLSLRQEHRPDGPGGQQHWVSLSVKDTGPGIPEKLRVRIFEPYFTTKPPGEGTGLGLATVRGIVRDHRGELRLHTREGEGTRFEILLPELRKADAVAVPPAPLRTGHGEHVLLIDDENPVRTVVRRILESLGYRVTTCSDGVEALSVFSADPASFDLVFTDFTMRGKTGITLARELLVLRPELPVLLGTGHAESVDRDTVLAAGVRGLLLKPYSVPSLATALYEALSPAGKGESEPTPPT